MITPQLTQLFVDCGLAIFSAAEYRIKQLKLARLIDVYGRGLHAAQVTETGIVNAIIAVCIDRPYGSDVAKNVMRVRSHRGKGKTAGDALDAIFLARGEVPVSIEASGAWVLIGNDLYITGKKNELVTRRIDISGKIIARLAAALDT